jgi:hypothetical protein
MAETRLRPDRQPLALPEVGFVIVSDSVDAEVTTFPASVAGARSGGQGLTPAVLRSADVREMGTVVLHDHHPEREHEKTVSLYVPAGVERDCRLLLYFDESGGVTFHLSQVERRPPAGVRAAGETSVRFEVPLRRPVRRPGGETGVRGIGGLIARQVLKVLGWKVAGLAARRVGPHAGARLGGRVPAAARPRP